MQNVDYPTRCLAGAVVALVMCAYSASAGPRQASSEGITHSFLAFGNETYLMGSDGKVAWSYTHNTRDGFMLPSGNILMAITRSKEYPSGGAVEGTREGKVVFEFKGTQSEVTTVQAVGEGRYMMTEAGPKPRIIEVDRDGKITHEVPIQAQTKDHHLQTRMTRKLPNGNYLVPQLLDKVVREYTPEGKILWEAKTPDMPAECWPFTAIRLPNGNTLIDCTHGLMSIEVDPPGQVLGPLTK